jgi:hypothetical protein
MNERLAAIFVSQFGQDAVHKRATPLASVELGETNRLGDHHTFGSIRLEAELVEAKTEDRPIHHWHTVHLPVLGDGFDLGVEEGEVAEHPFD